MTISGFTIVRNAEKLYFPIQESIRSILPIVDEFIIAIDPGDADDATMQIIEDIQSEKIKLFKREWEIDKFLQSEILAHETNFALNQCTGDWCFYLQADEVVHEEDLKTILHCCEKHLHEDMVEGLIFNYLHFWGDYNHFLPFHGWYKNEIRIIKNQKNIISIKDAQSFRKVDGSKLNVIKSNARIFHYGWVRPPNLMQSKKKFHDGIHHGSQQVEEDYALKDTFYDYGPLGRLPLYLSTHPQLMEERIKSMNWKDQLNYGKKWIPNRPLNKHEKLSYRILTWIENKILGGNELFGYRNWNVIKTET